MSDSVGADHESRFHRHMTVAHVREPPDRGYVEVMFFESARIYQLPRDHPELERFLRLLQEAMEAGESLRIALASFGSELIEGVSHP